MYSHPPLIVSRETVLVFCLWDLCLVPNSIKVSWIFICGARSQKKKWCLKNSTATFLYRKKNISDLTVNRFHWDCFFGREREFQWKPLTASTPDFSKVTGTLILKTCVTVYFIYLVVPWIQFTSNEVNAFIIYIAQNLVFALFIL